MSARNAGKTLTFLGARREDPCEERTDEPSSVMACGVQAVLRVCERGRAEQTVASSALNGGRDGVGVQVDHVRRRSVTNAMSNQVRFHARRYIRLTGQVYLAEAV